MTNQLPSLMLSGKRQLGAYYTPAPIVRFMLQSCLDGPLRARLKDRSEPIRILDPSCGDGAFLLEALRVIERHQTQLTGSRRGSIEIGQTALRAEIVRRHLFGVDVDPRAIAQIRRAIAAEIGQTDESDSSMEHILTRNIHIGDALTGPDFSLHEADAMGERGSRRAARENERPNRNSLHLSRGTIDWLRDFPDAARAGGFDLVIGNPPYRREKGAERLFRTLAKTPLGRRWRQPRMDLWHYFLHRGLDLLRPGGVLSYIINSYWMSAMSARPMIQRLREETAVREVVLLGDAPLFDGVAGRHMILQVQKGGEDSPCRVIDLRRHADGPSLLQELDSVTGRRNGRRAAVETIPQSELYSNGRFTPLRSSAGRSQHAFLRLGDLLEVRQGIAENPPFVTRAIRDELGDDCAVGSGVFVLTADELGVLNLSPHEQTFVRPYYAAKEIDRYRLTKEPTRWILYLTRTNAPEISRLPAIAAHLNRFRPVLERRREVRRGRIGWWHLHWPREERLFIEPRILAVQMCRAPRFVYVERPTYVGFAVNVIRSSDPVSFDLRAAASILNSRWAASWFDQHAKRRGVGLDISGTLLREFPFPVLPPAVEKRLAALCASRQTAEWEPLSVRSAGVHPCESLEHEVETLIDHFTTPPVSADAESWNP